MAAVRLSPRKMKILLVNQYYPPDTAPTGQYLHELARMLVARGHAVTAVCSRRAYNGSDTYAAEEVLDGVRVRRVTAFGFGRRSGLGKLLDYASFYALLGGRLFRPGERPDVVLALTTPPHVGLLAGWAARASGATHAHWVMDLYPDVLDAHGALRSTSMLFRWLAGLTRRELRGSPLVVCLGDDMAERLRGYASPPTPVESLPLWSDPSLHPWPDAQPPPFRAEQGWTPDDLVLMYSGNMGRGHRLGEFLQAASRLKAQPHTRWVFAGGGKRRGEVEVAIAADPALPVTLLPYAPVERLREHLCSADVHLASLDAAWEGCMVPSKTQGIFAVGKPLIFVGGARNSIARWIHASGGGWVVPQDDVAALCAAVEESRDPAERVRRGRAARAFAEAQFDRDRNAGRFCEWIETRCAPPRRNGVASPVGAGIVDPRN